MNVDDLPSSFLRSLNLKLLVFYLREGMSKIWIPVKNSLRTLVVFSNSDQEITLEVGNLISSFRNSFIYANVIISTRKRLWNIIPSIAPSNKPWLLVG